MYLPLFGPIAALALSGTALCLLASAPLGTRLEWWPYGFGLYRLMPLSGIIAALAVILALFMLAFGRSRLRPGSLMMLAVALLLSAGLIYVPVHYFVLRSSLPAIHDLTTDIDNPPRFSAVLAARAKERASSVDNRGPQLAQLQVAAYPELRPITTALSAAQAFQQALEVAKSMPNWTIVAADANAGRIEASEQSRWFRFTDDVVIRVIGDEAGSRIDMRSTSRKGTSDYGVNSARIRAYMEALRKRIG
jgi:uncharacterized protein (DUF1499 family)